MRIHVDDQPVAQFVVVTLDGELLEHVVWADDVAGVAEVEVFDETGPVKEEGRTLIEQLTGEVSISLVDSAPEWVAQLYKQLVAGQAAKAAQAEQETQAGDSEGDGQASDESGQAPAVTSVEVEPGVHEHTVTFEPDENPAG